MPVLPDKYRGTKEYFLVYSELIRAARYRGTTTYQAIAQIMGLPLTGSYMGSETGRVIGEISEDELQQGRPMLSALVLGISGRPGKGFFGLAQQLGKLAKDATEEEQLQFWQAEIEAIHDTWKTAFK